MSTAEDIMADAREDERLAEIDARHDRGDHDERMDHDCQRCINAFNDAARFYRPSRSERQVITADAEGWVRDWDFIRDEERGK